MTYLANPAHYAPGEFRALLNGLKFDKGWRPQFPTLHNTGVPTLKQWLAMGDTPKERWGANLNAYYRKMGWHAGPHLVVCPDYIWVLCDPEQDGVSVSCWNKVTFGIEMVGNYEVGGDDFTSGQGAKVRDNAVFVLAALCEKFGWKIADVLHFHRECVRDHHACPGSRVSKAEIVQRVSAQLESWAGRAASPSLAAPPPAWADRGAVGSLSGEAHPDGAAAQRALQAPANLPVAAIAPRPDLSTVEGVQRALNVLGFGLEVDGVDGPDTDRAIRTFQRHVGIAADGVAGAVTQAAIRKELSRN